MIKLCKKSLITAFIILQTLKSSPAEAGKFESLREYIPPVEVTTPVVKEVVLKPKLDTSTFKVDTQIVAAAIKYMGVPYSYGSMSKKGIDCSGLVLASLNLKRGKTLGSTAAAIFKKTKRIKVPKKGCLVFFNKLKHVGIMLDDKRFIHASSSEGVKISKLDNYWKPKVAGFTYVDKK